MAVALPHRNRGDSIIHLVCEGRGAGPEQIRTSNEIAVDPSPTAGHSRRVPPVTVHGPPLLRHGFREAFYGLQLRPNSDSASRFPTRWALPSGGVPSGVKGRGRRLYRDSTWTSYSEGARSGLKSCQLATLPQCNARSEIRQLPPKRSRDWRFRRFRRLPRSCIC